MKVLILEQEVKVGTQFSMRVLIDLNIRFVVTEISAYDGITVEEYHNGKLKTVHIGNQYIIANYIYDMAKLSKIVIHIQPN